MLVSELLITRRERPSVVFNCFAGLSGNTCQPALGCVEIRGELRFFNGNQTSLLRGGLDILFRVFIVLLHNRNSRQVSEDRREPSMIPKPLIDLRRLRNETFRTRVISQILVPVSKVIECGL